MEYGDRRSLSPPRGDPIAGGYRGSRAPMAVRGIIPPHMLKHLAESDNPEDRRLAVRMLMRIEKVRGMRRALGEFYVAAPTGGRCIRVYDVKHGSDNDLPGDLIANPAKSKDPEVKEAYGGADATYSFYKDLYGRNSIDDKGMCIDSSVHFETNYDNAGWDGRQMIYGDGDGVYFNRFTIAIDVIGHELTHGVTEYEAGLVYQDQPGALNESMSDVFGTLVKQRVLSQTVDQADWLIGEGIFTKKVKGKALRSMSAPGTAYDDPNLGKDPQPADMKHYVKTTEDEGGVHINSGIPNHAFYLTAMEPGGFAWEKAGRIRYVTLRDALKPKTSFATAAKRTLPGRRGALRRGEHGAGGGEEGLDRRRGEGTEVTGRGGMIIHLVRSGGFGGIRREVRIETQSLSREEREPLEGLVQASGFFSLPRKFPRPGKGADYFTYSITVDDGERRHTVEVSERSLPEGLRPLIREVSKRLPG